MTTVSMTRLLIVVLLTAAAASSTAGVLAVDMKIGLPSYLYDVDPDTDTLVLRGSSPYAYPWDIQVAGDGYLYLTSSAGSLAMQATLPDLSGWRAAFPVRDSLDLAMGSDGRILALDVNSYGDPRSAVWSVGLDGSIELVDTIPGFNMRGMDVPREGPWADGLLVVGYDEAPPHDFWLYRYRRTPSGRLDREGPLGPLESSDFSTCRLGTGGYGSQEHLVVRCDGLRFLTKEGCTGRVLEHDADGRFLGTLALIDDDPTVLDPTPSNPLAVFDDDIRALHVTDADEVYVATRRRLYHLDANGGLLLKFPDLFRGLNALGSSDLPTFPQADGACRASGVGYWKRQCLTRGLTMARRPVRGRSTAAPVGPDVHPDFSRSDLERILGLATRDLMAFGVDTCEALWPSRPREWRSRALQHLAALLLDVESGRLGVGCRVRADSEFVTVRELLQRMEAHVESGADEDFREAVRLAVQVHGGGE